MARFKDQWNAAMALDVLQHKTVDSATWSEAVKWLLLYGPPEIQEMINQASNHAARESFPELSPKGYGDNGQPYYDVHELAKALGVSVEEVVKRAAEVEKETRVAQLRDHSEVHKIH